MPTEIYLLKVGMNMTEGVVEEWYIEDGGSVATGELLYRLETEKVNMDIDAESSGVVKHLVGEGVTLQPGDVVGYIYAADEVIPDELPEAAASVTAVAETTNSTSVRTATTTATTGRILCSPIARRLAGELNVAINLLTGTGPAGRIIEADIRTAAAEGISLQQIPSAQPPPSSPMARKLARELGINLDTVRGTGPGGRITKDDVEAATATAPVTVLAADIRANSKVPVKGMRKTIASRMLTSLQTMAQLTMDMDVNMDDAVKLRQQLINEWSDRGIKPSYTDLVIRAVAKALENHPRMNATFDETEITLLGSIHVGMAVAIGKKGIKGIEEGLIVPVLKHTNQLTMEQLAAESGRLAVAAKDGALGIDDLQGGTFTVSTLGMFGVDSFTPIINSPQVGILGVNRIRDDVGWEGSVPVKRQVMRLSLTWDHRALDGAPAALFLAEVKTLLEAPYRLLV